MRLFTCICGNTLFFDNTVCTICGRSVGWCDACETISALEPQGGHFICHGNPASGPCGAEVALCMNYAVEQVCNRTVPLGGAAFCRYCALNDIVPDMGVAGNRERWARLEAAKRRLLYALDRLGLPYGRGMQPRLSFAFMGDPVDDGLWRTAGEVERVYTGHANGRITINIAEADDAEREQLRVDFGEAHRTLIGHFRHEIGHYYWDAVIRGRDEAGFAAQFGDPHDPSYSAALNRYYEQGPPADWRKTYVSAYATMHPWEDWAETWALYLDMASVIDTATELGLLRHEAMAECAVLIRRYRSLGLVLNELNREMGLLDFAPEIITPRITQKLGYVHDTIRTASRGGFLDNRPAL